MNELRILVAAKVTDPLLPDHKSGYSCVICHERLQLSPLAVTAAKNRYKVFCDDCGFMLIGLIQHVGIPIMGMATRDFMEQVIEHVRKADKAENN